MYRIRLWCGYDISNRMEYQDGPKAATNGQVFGRHNIPVPKEPGRR